jgi:RNA polymerase sigma-70 factor (ECF subfamily)
MATTSTAVANSWMADPDVGLMLRVQQDDAEAFEQLVHKYQERVLNVFYQLLGDAEEAEDLTQEVFLRVYRSRKRYKPTARFSTWLFTIVNNLALNARRDRRRRPTRPFDMLRSSPESEAPVEQLLKDPAKSAASGLAQAEMAALVRRALDQLNERQRLALILHKYEDMSYTEIGAVMNLGTAAVKSLLARARAHLRQILAPYIEAQ